ncbi:hypothetical protein [Streptacidiphilus sp. EB129]|uniref:hypothetical protein n=1 Tax=Streptacidiphilus sp. EB129 TaxID=3156262 RepID=UPI003514A0B1
MVERLRAEGVPVELTRIHPTALNLLDLLLAEGVPVADPPPSLTVDLGAWLANGDPGRRDLAAVAADPRFRGTLRDAIPPVWGPGDDDRLGALVARHPVLQALVAEWADEQADRLLSARGLAGAYSLLLSLGPVRRAVMGANPAAAARIAGLDVAALLGRTLRAGILDELGWTALEEGLRRLGYDDSAVGAVPGRTGKNDLQVEDAWPALILIRRKRAVVVGPHGVLLEHDLRVPSTTHHWQRPRLRFVDGELLVAWNEGRAQRAYWSSDFLSKELLARFGLKAAAARTARTWVRAIDQADRDAVLAALLPADPAGLWDGRLAVDAAAERWIQRRGRLVTLPDEVRASVHGASIEAIEEVLNPATTAWLSRTTTQRLRRVDRAEELVAEAPVAEAPVAGELVADDSGALPGVQSLAGAVHALRWPAHNLPYGDALRPLLPTALAAIRSRLADPGLLLDLDVHSTLPNKSPAAVLPEHAGLPQFTGMAQHTRPPEQGGAAGDGLVSCGEALVLAPGQVGEAAYLRPSALTGAQDPSLDLLGGLVAGFHARPTVAAVRALLSDDLARLVADGSSADEPPGWAQNPQRSVPALVAEVSRACGLGEDAAALYLQLLALPDPTDRNSARWTGWTPARLKRARAELAATDLVLEARRARAGRGLFLPGGWQETRSPGLPVENWKAGLYELPAAGAILPHRAAPVLFADAWARLTAGDRPGDEELTTNTRRRDHR